MKNVFFLICFFVIFHIVSCTPTKKPNPVKSNEYYPDEIVSKGLQDLFDESKWQLYCYHSDTRLIFNQHIITTDTPFAGSLDLKFDRLITRNDTTEFRFYYYYKDTVKCDVNSIKNYFDLSAGIAYKGFNKDSIIYFASGTNFTYSRGNNKNLRYDNVLQPDVISFINQHKNSLNNWFYEEARRRKVIR